MQLAKFQNEFTEYKINSYVLLISLYHYKKKFLVQHTNIGTKIVINNIMNLFIACTRNFLIRSKGCQGTFLKYVTQASLIS